LSFWGAITNIVAPPANVIQGIGQDGTFTITETGILYLFSIILAVAIIFLCVVWVKSAEINEKHIGLAVIITIIGVPHIHYHDLALLLIPIFGIMRIMLDKKLLKTSEAVLLPLAASLLMFVSFLLLPGLKYIVYYILIFLMLAALWFPEKIIFWKKINNPPILPPEKK